MLAIAVALLGAAAPNPAAAQSEADPLPASSALHGVYTSDQAERGERLFDEICSACHQVNEFSGFVFRMKWVGRTAGDLYVQISTAMPLNSPGSLAPDEYAALVAYLLQMNGYPHGAAPLSHEVSSLMDVKLEAPPSSGTGQ